MTRFHATCAAAMVLVFTVCSRAAEPVLATDLLRVKEIIDVAIARDASFAIFSVRSIAEPRSSGEDSRYTYEDHLWMVDLRAPNSRPVQLTFNDHQDTAPAISPDGSKLAFVRLENRPGALPQIWLMPLSQPGEAREITNLEFGAVDPRWQPDGRSLLVSSAIPLS
ncbi:MAG TPA: hypothetical protein VF023_07165, partial [Bryobacteraceae bacterium]